MGLTSALTTSLNGLALNEQTIDVLGNNIANAGTNGFKSSTVLFQTQLAQTLSVGSRPTSNDGGTNPRQTGLGATTAAIVKDFSPGSITNSKNPSDLAIQGDGFFILNGRDGNVYTRAGNFNLNSEDVLTAANGLRVQGYGVDQDFNLITTQLTDISIPVGDLVVAQQTRNIEMSGALFSAGDIATQGTVLVSNDVFSDTASSTFAANPATPATLLTSLFKEGDATALFSVTDEVSFTPRKGGRLLETQTLVVGAGTTLADLFTLMDETLGLQGGVGIPLETGVTPNVVPQIQLNAAGEIEVIGNRGTVNDLDVTIGDLVLISGGTPATLDLAFTETQTADGESTITDYIVFDSLGQEVNIKFTTYLESRDSTSSTFRYFVESNDDSDTDIVLGDGTFVFDSNGEIASGGISQFQVDRENTAASNMQLTIDVTSISGISGDGSTVTMQDQDGSNPGTLSRFVLDESGVINGIFDNGIIRTMGQVVLARFSNSQGLLENGDTTYLEGVSSGSPFLVTPGNFGAGTIRAGAIELSNTDIGRNLVDLIVASTNYRGNARVISSVQQLIDELLVLGR